jgi:DNA polymerase-3 subunit epsilon
MATEVTWGFVDLETTGLDWRAGERIAEIAIDLYRTGVGPAPIHIGSFARRVNPGKAMTKRAAEITGLTWEMLAHEPPYATIAPHINALFAQLDFLVAHNGIGFDFPFIKHEQTMCGYDEFPNGLIDTMTSARWATPNGKAPKLSELCFAVGVEYDPALAHSALYDTQVMAQAFFAGQRLGFFPHP